jgi:D-serine deaminase-like pyridoxal phosphate-dependent protein
MDLNKIIKPALILDENKCRINIARIAEKARASGVLFRPHFKTHQSEYIGRLFREEGINQITVSSVTMAQYFASAGWKDITIAFPLNIREISDAENLSAALDLNILISSFQQAQEISRCSKLNAGCFIKIDTGNKRCGFEWNDKDQIMRTIDKMRKNRSLRFKGFLTHSGHTYKAANGDQIIDIYNDTLVKMSHVRKYSADKSILSTGDTPSCSLVDDLSGFDEVRPGNFVFYDLMQYFLGSCKFDEIAVAVACPVVEKNFRRKEIVIYGGGVHLSKDCVKEPSGQSVYGLAVLLNEAGWTPFPSNNYVRSISQEHGIVSSTDELLNSIKIGDLIGIIPVHSCMTADLLRQYHTTEGNLITDFSPK